MKNQTINTIGFIGLGVMGNSMCKNLLQNKNWSIMVNDINKNKEEDLPPDVKEIRNKLLEELEEYLNDGGLADHFIERTKKIT